MMQKTTKFEKILMKYNKTINDFKSYCKENKISIYSVESKKLFIKLLLKENK